MLLLVIFAEHRAIDLQSVNYSLQNPIVLASNRISLNIQLAVKEKNTYININNYVQARSQIFSIKGGGG